MLKRVIENPGKKAILVLPYVALVQEKLRWLRSAVENVQKKVDQQPEGSRHAIPPRQRADRYGPIRVVAFIGGSRARATWADFDIAVCTIEKANSLINSAMQECVIDQLGVVVMDEMHMINDEHRGYMLELISSKLRCFNQGLQIIGMSATLSNSEQLAEWLCATYYESSYRPVPVDEFVVCDNHVYQTSRPKVAVQIAGQTTEDFKPGLTQRCRTIERSHLDALSNPLVNSVLALTMETVEAGYGVIVFCGSRKGCETTASLISEAMPQDHALPSKTVIARRDILAELRSSGTGLDSSLQTLLPKGVAFHHAGLTTEERGIIADSFDRGFIKVIVATCSLATGINLPARRVILHGVKMGREVIGPAMLRQMRGRAGRKGKDEVGESYLCCHKSDLDEVSRLLVADCPLVTSSLTPEKRGLKRALLEIIFTQLATSIDAICDYVQHTLLRYSMNPEALDGFIQSTLKSLVESSLVTVDGNHCYHMSRLGNATVAASLTPEDGLFIHNEIERALRAFVMDGELHVFYMFTPMQDTNLGDVNWQIFAKEMDRLDESDLRVLDFVGINPMAVVRLSRGAPFRENTSEEINAGRVYRRFYAALQLRDLCNEVPVHAVARKYESPRGAVQMLAQTCQGFAAGIIKFCERMGWAMLAAVLTHMSDRLRAGAKADLLDLAQVTFIKSRTARIFWENGVKNVRTLAEMDPDKILPILMLAQPKKLRMGREDDQHFQEKLKSKADMIVRSARRLWDQQSRFELED
ncbi:MAG: hypothetical protein M1825_001818 [Sarcosagium campestre]|nr:MAG: hypothetical protein M1825_001818 [Sarcosagium campestre]